MAFTLRYLEAKARQYGSEAGMEMAEAFKVLTLTHLHFNVDAERC